MNKLFFAGLALTAFISLAGFSVGETFMVAAQGRPGQRPQGPPPEQGRRGGPDGGKGMMFRLLDLSREQKDQIKTLHDAEQAAAKTMHEQIKPLRDQLHAATKDGTFNESIVRALLAQAQQPELEMEVLRLKTRTAIYHLLTPAQKARLTELQEAREKNHDGPPPPPRD